MSISNPKSTSLLDLSSMVADRRDGDVVLLKASRAVELDPQYSAAWKLYGKALTDAGRHDDAIAAYAQGIEVAERRGDKQAAKEMTVFHKRLLKQASS